ncbi:hypothetical protein PG996_004791 [Apiospora saccharicola]|uniref:Uncharacterized protein n=1 Tax=Apiospora saccharicola TaxID=335842 RepID=A0ABR1W7U5_9PEZI
MPTNNDLEKNIDDESPKDQKIRQQPEYTINDISFLLFGLPFSFLARYGLTPWIDVPDHIDLSSADAAAEQRWVSGCYMNNTDNISVNERRSPDEVANQRHILQKLNFVFQYGAVIALTLRILRFSWRHKWDPPVWLSWMMGGFVSAHALRLLFGSRNVVDAHTHFMPWTSLDEGQRACGR